MKLNLELIKDSLPENIVIKNNCSKEHIYSLDKVLLYSPLQISVSKNNVFIANINALKDLSGLNPETALIFTGEGPDIPENHKGEYIRLSPEISEAYALMLVSDIFEEFNAWENRLLYAIADNHPQNEIGKIIYDFVKAPFMLVNGGYSLIFNLYDTNNEESVNLYSLYGESSYKYDELNIVLHDKEFANFYNSRKTFLYPKGIWKYRYLCQTIFHKNKRVGILILGEDYHEFTERDYREIDFLSQALREYVLNTTKSLLPVSYLFVDMIDELLKKESHYINEYNRILQEKKWRRFDTYYVFALKADTPAASPPELFYNRIILEKAFIAPYLHMDYKGEYQILILDQQRENSSLEVCSHTLKKFLDACGYQACAGETFSDISELRLHVQQALALFAYMPQSASKLFFFKDHISDLMASICLKYCPPQFFMSSGFKTLAEHEEKNRSQLMLTLYTYAENGFNATKSAQELHIHISTFKYRLSNIEKISGMDLDDLKTRSYLNLMFLIIDNDKEKKLKNRLLS